MCVGLADTCRRLESGADRQLTAVQHHVQNYSEPSSSTSYQGSSSYAGSGAVLPLGQGVLTMNLGIPIVVVCTRADRMDVVGDELGMKGQWEERTDWVQQALRTICLSCECEASALDAPRSARVRVSEGGSDGRWRCAFLHVDLATTDIYIVTAIPPPSPVHLFPSNAHNRLGSTSNTHLVALCLPAQGKRTGPRRRDGTDWMGLVWQDQRPPRPLRRGAGVQSMGEQSAGSERRRRGGHRGCVGRGHSGYNGAEGASCELYPPSGIACDACLRGLQPSS